MARKRRPARSGYLVFLIPGLLLSTAVVVVPLAMTVATSFTRWQGVGAPTWIGIDNYVQLAGEPSFWASFLHIASLIVAMAILPTLIGLVLATVLVEYIATGVGTRTASGFRAGFYLPQILPVAIAGIVWGWILHPGYGALNSVLRTIGLSSLTQIGRASCRE